MVTYRLFGKALILLVLMLATHSLSAQTLSEKLIEEDPAKLILQAREEGDIVRGAILFHQGNIACAKCHRPTADQNRIGPDLSRLSNEVTDESIVESILRPSKVIAKEYQTLSVLDVDGYISTGIVAREDENAIVLRDSKNLDQLITIKRELVEEVMPGATSIMPSGLVDELQGRQQFLDLLRYVLDMKDRGPEGQGAAARILAQRELTPELNGLLLLRKNNCAACHLPQKDDEALLTVAAPDLRWSARRLNPAQLAEFIASPQQVKSGTVMPQMMLHMDAAARTEAANAIVQYLVSRDGNDFRISAQEFDRAAIPRGFELFHSVGCVACHAPRNDDASEQSLGDSVPLGDLHGKYSLSALIEFLKNPHAVRPRGRMPGMQLTHREAIDVSNYLLQRQLDGSAAERKPIAWQPNAALVQQGEALFTSLKCGRCHTGIDESPQVKPAAKAMANLDLNKGCLARKPGEHLPQYSFADSEKSHIRAALSRANGELKSNEVIDFNLAHFNCIACHRRNDLGGVSSERNVHFQTSNLNLGDQGRIPPSLTGVGAKLNPMWMRDVLVKGRSIRPYMKTRMPQYGEQNIGHLIELFQATDRLAEREFAEFEDQKEVRNLGLELVGNQGLNCVACHTYQYKLSDTMPAVDLTEMAERLKKNWFYHYMLAPQKFSPNTVMPSFWPNGNAIRPDLPGTPEYQIEAIWQYLLDGRQARAPRGVIRPPLEIVVDDQPRMLRRSYPDIGKRGIGVGYPGKVNLAFDAEQLRLATLWRGRFVDPSGVWYGQGHGRVRPLGNTVSLPKGPELDEPGNHWMVDEGRPPDHQFKGYVLDKDRRPTFRYSLGSVDVEDFFAPFEDEATGQVQLRRRIKLIGTESSRPLRFRLMTDERPTLAINERLVIGDRLRIRVVSEHDPMITDYPGGQQAIIPLAFDTPGVQELVLEYCWE